MQMSIAHPLSSAEARERMESAAHHYGSRHPNARPKIAWKDATHATVAFNVRGKNIEVEIALEEGRVDVSARVPLLFRPFEGLIRTRVEAEAAAWLVKPTP